MKRKDNSKKFLIVCSALAMAMSGCATGSTAGIAPFEPQNALTIDAID